MKPMKILENGAVYDRLTIIEYDGRLPPRSDGRLRDHKYKTECECGEIKIASQTYLLHTNGICQCKKCADLARGQRNLKVHKGLTKKIDILAYCKPWR